MANSPVYYWLYSNTSRYTPVHFHSNKIKTKKLLYIVLAGAWWILVIKLTPSRLIMKYFLIYLNGWAVNVTDIQFAIIRYQRHHIFECKVFSFILQYTGFYWNYYLLKFPQEHSFNEPTMTMKGRYFEWLWFYGLICNYPTKYVCIYCI